MRLKCSVNYFFIIQILFVFSLYSQSTGWLKITSEPTDADITIDGVAYGTTPTTKAIELSAGIHILELYYKDYEEKRVEVTIIAGEVTKREVTLLRSKGFKVNPEEQQNIQQSEGKITVFIEPEDEGWEIYGDGELIQDKPPFTATTGAGKHRIKAIYNIKTPIPQEVEIEKVVYVKDNKVTKVYFNINEKLGKLTVNANLANSKDCAIYVNGGFVNEAPPFTSPLSAGAHIVKAVFEFENPVKQKIELQKEVYVRINKNTRIDFNIADKIGSVNILANKPDAKIYIDEMYYTKTPQKNMPLSLGQHKITVKKDGFTEFTKTVNITRNKTTNVQARLLQMAELNLTVSPKDADVYINDMKLKIEKPYAKQGNYKLHILPSKTTTIRVTKKMHEKWEKSIKPKEGEKLTIKSTLDFYKGFLKIKNYIPGTVLKIDQSGLVLSGDEHQLPVGQYKTELSAPGYFNKSDKISINRSKTTLLNGFMARKTLQAAMLRSFALPGWGQAYQEKGGRSWIYTIAYFGGGIGSYFYTNKYNMAISEYNDIRADYSKAFEENEINSLRNEMHSKYDEINSAKNTRNIFYAATGGIWLVNMLDILILPPGWKKNVSITSNINQDTFSAGLYFKLNK